MSTLIVLIACISGLAAAEGQLSCPDGMVAVAGFCMDRFEAPNQVGANPLTAVRATEGETWCAAQGKRLCSEAEWVRACQGATGRKYPYGNTYRKGLCNDDKEWRIPNWSKVAKYPSHEGKLEVERLYQADPSGSRPGCVSTEGVYDLTGNAAEWVTRSFSNRTNFAHVMKGCYWAGCYGGAHPSCGFVNPAHPGKFRSYEAGFRCCLSQAK